ncbi:MAG: hypothetical protein LBJ44_06420 [Propionibacteriaceae bacterium]|jgi:phosphatidylserine synthase|nr:hypothetical protein [Propionibacteriaceae bacterium]
MNSQTKDKTRRTNYDERQLRLRGDCFMHGFVVMCALCILQVFLSRPDSHWSPGPMGVLSLLIGLSVVTVEMIARGAYFGLKPSSRPAVAILLVLASAVLWVVAIVHLLADQVWSGGGLTETGYALIDAIVFTSVPIAIAFKAGLERRRSDEDEAIA